MKSPANFVGRVGALAAALGVGAVFGGFGLASADTGPDSSDGSSASASESGSSPSSNAPRRAGSQRSTGTGRGTDNPASRSRTARSAATSVPPSVIRNQDAPTVTTNPAPPSAPAALAPAAVNVTVNTAPKVSPTPAAAAAVVAPASTVTPAAKSAPASPAAALPTALAAITAKIAPTAVTAAASAPVQAAAAPLRWISDLLSPLLGSGAGFPAESPASWLVLSAARRTARTAPGRAAAAAVTTGQTVLPAATTGTTTTVTWAWGTNPVLAFNPATDKLDFGWMGPTQFDVTEKSGSTVISVVDNNHTYTLQNVPVSQLQMTNIVAKDTGTVSKWQNLITTAQGASTPTVSIANASLAEGNSGSANMAFTVSLSKAATKAVTVGYSTANGTATAGSDYTATSGTLTFAPGVTSQKVNVAVTGDTTVETDETFTVKLANPSNATLGTATATGTITNDDIAPTVSIANASLAEGNSGASNMAFTVSLSKAATNTVTVGYSTANGTATAGSDYTATTGTLTFAPGVTSQKVNVAVTGDTTVEPDETFTLKLASPSNATLGTATATGTITNDDVAPTLPTVSIANASLVEGNSGTANMGFTVTLSKAATNTVTVGYSTANGTATAGSDYTATTGTLTFAPGVTSQKVNVAVTGDTAVEPDETFTLKLASPSNATLGTATATGTITNDDVAAVVPPTISITNATVAEGNSGTTNMAFTVSLSKATDKAVTVGYSTSNGTATAGQDYTAASGTLTFAAGTTSQQVNVSVIGDTTVESAETFTVTLTNPTNGTLGTATATGTITNDDSDTPPPATADRWGNAFYAPYVDMGGWPVPNLLAISQTNAGGSLFTAAFMQATPDGKLAWAGLNALTPDAANDQAKAINSSIKALQAAGGDVMVSLGGQAGTSLAQWGSTHGMTAQQLANAYAGVIDTYGITHLDFDIEGAAVADPASIALNSQALKLLQQSKPDLKVWYTLPVLPTGLTADGINVVDSALKAGVKLAGVNVMAMDYGESAAPTSGAKAKTMGAYAIDSAESTYSQMTTLYKKYGQTFSYSQLGVTPMLGVNDITTEVFTPTDAQALEDYARSKGVGMLALWSVTRDTPGQLGVSTYTHSGMSVAAGTFAKIFNDYGTVNALNYGTTSSPGGGSSAPPVSGGTTTTIGWNWGTNTVLNFNTAKDKLDFVWMQPANFDITESAGSTKITIVGNSQTYTLNNVPLSTMSINNIVALDSTTVAKWQNAIATAQTSAGPTLSIAGTTVAEGNSGSADATFAVSLSKASASAVTVGYSTANGTATAGTDYTATSGTLTFAPGTTTQQIKVKVTGDTTVEPDETFTVTLTNPAGATLATASATGTITNDDAAPVLPTISVANATVAEGNTGTANLAFTVTLSKAATSAVTVGYSTANGTATAGSDYTATSGTLTFAPGVTSQTVNVAVTGDTVAEANETLTLNLASPTGATVTTPSATGTITNDDAAPVLPTISVANATVAEGNTGTANLAFTVTLSKAATSAVTVGYSTANGTATAGSDYTATSGTLTFAPGVTSQTVNVGVIGDTTVEPTETLTVTLTSPVGASLATATATGTITNDDAAVPAPAQTKILAAYYPEWGVYARNFQPADIPANELTHVIYSFLNLTPSGEVAIYDSYAATEKRFTAAESVSGEADLWYYPPSDPRSQQTVWGNFNQLAQLKQKNPNLRVNIALGGWTLSSNFSNVVSTAAGREKLANSIVGFLNTYRMFDGIDFDWEYPGGGGLDGNSASPNDGANYAELLKVVRTKLDGLGTQLGRTYEISVASPAGYDKIANFNLAGLAPSVNYFNLMAYDFHGTWEKTTGHMSAFTGDPKGYDVKHAVDLYLAAGIDPNKIVLGAPLYTKAWSGVADGGDGGYLEPASGSAPGSFEAGTYDYKDLLAQLKDPNSGWKLYWDDNAQAAYLYNKSKGLFSSFETPTSIAQKSEWAQALGLRGMMFWDISNDAIASPDSLVKAAYDSWVLHQNLATIRANSSIKNEVILGGDGAITAIPASAAAAVKA